MKILARLFIFIWTIFFANVPNFVSAQTSSTLENWKGASPLSQEINRERNLAVLPSQIHGVSESPMNLSPLREMKGAAKREEGPLVQAKPEFRSRSYSPIQVESKLRVIPSETKGTFITNKLALFAEALSEGRISGFEALEGDPFMKAYVRAAAIELSSWLAENQKNGEFQNLFRGRGPWTLVFLTISPTSMEEYLENLDLPGEVGDLLEAKRLPVNVTVQKQGQELRIELAGALDLYQSFRMNDRNEIIPVTED